MRTLLLSLVLVVAACGGAELSDDPTTLPPETTTTTTVQAGTVSVYFMADSGGNKVRSGPFLAPVAREGDTVEDALEALIAGPMETGFSSSVPEGTSLLGVSVDGGVATVDLSSEFDDGGGTFSMTARLAQLTYTVTAADPSISGVLLALDGDAVTVFSSEGIVIDAPMTRNGFEDLLPGILVERPAFGESVSGPLDIVGVGAAFEGVFQLEVLDAAGAVVATVPFVQTDNGVGWGNFEVNFEDLSDAASDLTIRVFELSAEDGSVVSERFVSFSWRP